MPRGSALWFCGPFAPCRVLRLSQRHADAAADAVRRAHCHPPPCAPSAPRARALDEPPDRKERRANERPMRSRARCVVCLSADDTRSSCSQRRADAAGITSTKQVPHAKSGNLSPKCTLSQFAWHVLPRNARFSLRVSRTTASSACNIKHFSRSEIGHCAGTRSRSQIIVHFSVFLPSNISQSAFLAFLATTLPHKTKPASRTPVEHPAKTPSHIIFPQARPDWILPTRAP